MKKIVLLSVCFFVLNWSYGQMPNPVSWKTEVRKKSEKEYELIIVAKIKENWALYSQNIAEGGPIATTFTFEPSVAYEKVGKVVEYSENKEVKQDKIFNMELIKYYDKVTFIQKIIVKDKKQLIKAKVRYMSCNDKTCIPPQNRSFEFPL